MGRRPDVLYPDYQQFADGSINILEKLNHLNPIHFKIKNRIIRDFLHLFLMNMLLSGKETGDREQMGFLAIMRQV